MGQEERRPGLCLCEEAAGPSGGYSSLYLPVHKRAGQSLLALGRDQLPREVSRAPRQDADLGRHPIQAGRRGLETGRGL